jgi:hypothetical protein
MTLDQAITEILANFTAGDYFDSHTVIDALFEKPEYHLAYLRGYAEHPDMEVRHYHGKIAKMIGANNIAKPIGKAKTHTIYGGLSENMLWQKT